MTDLATKHEADKAVSGDASDAPDADALEADALEAEVDAADEVVETPLEADAATEVIEAEPADADGGDPAPPPLAWAPSEPAPKKRRAGMWIGIAAGVAAVGLVAASLVLIAPGTSVAGVSVGGLTAGAATEAIAQRLATTTIVLTGPGGDAEVTGADLGATVNARELADEAFATYPAWNVTQWFPEPVDAAVHIDPDAATSALRAAAPALYTDPVDATLAFDATAVTYVTTPAVEGTGIDVQAVHDALQAAFVAGETRVEFDPVPAPVIAQTPTHVAEASAAQLNRILDTAGFYIGAERAVPIPRDVAASWLTVTPGDRGTFIITADEAAIQAVVDTLPAAVNRDPVNAVVITNSGGDVLREITAGVPGQVVGDTTGVASAFAAQLAGGDGVYPLPVDVLEFATTALARRIEVNLSSQRAFLWENGNVVNSYAISSGLPGSLTPAGNFRVFAHTSMTDMGCYEGAPYCTENVPWVTWFAPDIGFHGAYWHNNFGNRMSHGCVNMPVGVAKYVYDWTPVGTEVSVHY